VARVGIGPEFTPRERERLLDFLPRYSVGLIVVTERPSDDLAAVLDTLVFRAKPRRALPARICTTLVAFTGATLDRRISSPVERHRGKIFLEKDFHKAKI
jgi:hypothetical protein